MTAPVETALRAKECAAQLLADYRHRLTPENYARAHRFSRIAPRDIHPAAAAAMLRLHAGIVERRR